MMFIVMVTMRSFGATLKEEREAAGISQRALGDLIGVTGAAISQWESGGAPPSPDTVFELERVLGLPGGRLSAALGYIPTGEIIPDVLSAIDSDPNLEEHEKEIVRATYRTARKRPPRVR